MTNRTGRRIKVLGLILAGLMVTGTAIRALQSGRLEYVNPFGLSMFAPLALLIGVLLVFVAVKVAKPSEPEPRRLRDKAHKSRFRGWPK